MEVYPHPYLTHNSPDYLFLSFDNFNSITKAIINPIPPNNRTDAPYTVLINSRRPIINIKICKRHRDNKSDQQPQSDSCQQTSGFQRTKREISSQTW